ncbi:AraC family transcriptional regulator [Kerstersia sp.]|uniref:AraC family transcriptional regulator n=1 Tax=Kerstersia sp. TaxID=1930783 RepID=UPI003F8F8D32
MQPAFQPSDATPGADATRAGVGRAAISNYTMATRAQHAYFGIHNQSNSLPNPVPHRHEYFQIYVSIQGRTTHYIGGEESPIGPGTVSFVLPFLAHYIPNAADGVFYIINISKEFLLPSLDHDVLDLSEVPLARAPELAPFRFQHCLTFQFGQDETQRLQQMCERMEQDARSLQDEETVSHLLIRSHLLSLFGLVWKKYGANFRDCDARRLVPQTYKPAVLRCIRYVTQNLASEMTLSDAAQASCVSTTYLAHLLKSETGKTFLELVTERRMDRAKTLLAFTSEPSVKVAENVGFSEPAHFARRFRQVVGMTPSAYRQRFQLGGRPLPAD